LPSKPIVKVFIFSLDGGRRWARSSLLGFYFVDVRRALLRMETLEK